VLQQGLKDFDNSIANFFRPDFSAQVCRPQLQATGILCIQGFSHGGLDELRLLIETKGVAQKQSGAEDGTNGIGNPLSCNVRGGAVDGLIETRGGFERG
jgi:hypothetical protein